MVEVKVKAGICGFVTMIQVINDESGMEIEKIILDTDCSYIKRMEPELQRIDGVAECFEKFSTSKVYEVASRHCKHLACPVPCGILKGIEAASGLALPKNVEMEISKK